MSSRRFSIVIEKDEDGWLVASVPELPGCHTQAKTQDALLKRIREAILAYLEVTGESKPRTEFVGVQQLEVET